MNTRILKMMALIAAAVTVIPACDKKEVVKNLVVSISADDAFAEDNTAEVTISMSDAVTRNVVITVASTGAALPATTALPGSKIDFPSTVTIASGSTSATFTATLNPSGLEAGTYSVGIQLLSATGAAISQEASIAFIKAVVNGYGGGGGQSGESTPGEGSESSWSISYDGFKPFTYTDGYGQSVTEDCEVFSYTVPATQYVYMTVFDAGTYDEYIKGKSKSEIISVVEYAMQDELDTYYDEGDTFADLVGAGPDKIGFEEFQDGDYEAFIFGTDASGNPNGTYAWCSFTKTGSSVGGELDVEMTLQPSWTLTITGDELEYDDYNNAYIAARVTAPGSTYIYVDSYSDDELDYYYNGSLSAFAADTQSSLQTQLASSAIGDLLYTAGDCYVPYYEGGETTFYILDFDSSGMATGKYGKVVVNLPDLGGQGGDEPVLTGPLSFQSSWKAVYSGNYRIDVSGVTDKYFMFDIYNAAIPEADLESELIEMVSYNLSKYNYVYDGPSDYDQWDGFSYNAYYVYIAGLDDDYNLTGKYGYSYISVTSTSAASLKGTPIKCKAARPAIPAKARVPHRRPMPKAIPSVKALR